jgi:DNA-binding transcriptional regulator YdaS (Cro superfamily)
MNKYIDIVIKEVGAQVLLAQKLEVTPSFINQLRSGLRPIPPSLCPAMVRLSNNKVSLKNLRPTDWQKYWPELKTQ